MDEPTSSWPNVKSIHCSLLCWRWKKRGYPIFVSHKLNEVLRLPTASVCCGTENDRHLSCQRTGQWQPDIPDDGMKVEYEPFQFAGKFDHPILELNHVSKKGEYKDSHSNFFQEKF
jgi:hypothetical protein